MKHITVHAWTHDNSGTCHEPGSTLKVDDDGGEGCITAKAADGLVKINSATVAEAKGAKAPADA